MYPTPVDFGLKSTFTAYIAHQIPNPHCTCAIFLCTSKYKGEHIGFFSQYDHFFWFFLSPEGKCESTPDGVLLIFLWFIVLSLVNEKMSFNFAQVFRLIFSAKKLYCTGGWWVGGWVDGRQLGSFNFPQF